MKIIRSMDGGSPRAHAGEMIKRYVRSRGLRVGDQLPPYSELAAKLEVSILTVQRAMNDLADEGVIHRLRRKGTYVGKRTVDVPLELSQAGLIFPSSASWLLTEPYSNETLAGMLDACGAHHVDLTFLSLFAMGGKVPPDRIEGRLEGAIIFGVEDEEYIEEYARASVPVVVADYYAPAIPLPYVAVDNAIAVRHVMEHLVSLGHRRIAYVDGAAPDKPNGHRTEPSDSVERREAYLAFMQEAGLSQHVTVGHKASDDGKTCVRKLIDEPGGAGVPSAVATQDVSLAASIISALIERGLRVPEDVSVAAVAGAGADSIAKGLSLTYSSVHFRAMGMRAVESLIVRCRSLRPKRSSVIRIDSELVVGKTTGPCISNHG